MCALLASHSALLTTQDNHWHFALNQEHSALYNKEQEVLLGTILSRHFNAEIHVSIEIAVGSSIDTPEKARVEKASLALISAEESLQNNPHFRRILEQFHATIIPGSIMSLELENATNEV